MKTPEVTFGVMADCQSADKDDFRGKIRGTENEYFTNCYRLSETKMREAIQAFDEMELDFIVHLGDFVDDEKTDVDMLLDITRSSRAMVKHVLGNHEFWVPNTKPEDVIRRYDMPDKYYSFDVNDNRFIVLDTNEIGPLEHQMGSPEWMAGHASLNRAKALGKIQAWIWNGGLSSRQLDWLDEELDETDRNGQKAFLFAHHPVFPPHALNALNDTEIRECIDSHPSVKVFINGHNHGGNYGEENGVPYVTVEGMLSETTNAYGVAKVYDDHMTIDGQGRLTSRHIPYQR